MKRKTPLTSAERSKKYRTLQSMQTDLRKRNAESQRRSRARVTSRKMMTSGISGSSTGEVKNASGIVTDFGSEAVPHSTSQIQNGMSSFDWKELNRIALINIFQWRTPPARSEIAGEIDRVRRQIETDLKNTEDLLHPRRRVLCCSCGYKVDPSEAEILSKLAKEKVESLLEGRLYTTTDEPISSITDYRNCYNDVGTDNIEQPRSDVATCCRKCLRDIRSMRVPLMALCNGWNFSDNTPIPLLKLSKHERLLVSLRLPCIHTWRLQGGFGQYAAKGAPVSFANPVANLARVLPRRPTAVFAPLLENGKRIEIRVSFVRDALKWLKNNKGLYTTVQIDHVALREVEEIEVAQDLEEQKLKSSELEMSSEVIFPSSDETLQAEHREARCGTQGPLDGEALFFLESSAINGIEDVGDTTQCRNLIQHMLRPFSYRRNEMIPSYDAAKHLESYFPVLFPYGKGGPNTLRRPVTLAFWCKQALSVHTSPFKKDLDFIFFVNAILRRKRLSGLALNAPLRDRTVDALKEIRSLLNRKEGPLTVKKRIDYLIRSGRVNASFESLRGSAAFWATLKYTSWAYLVHFGPCQVFLTMSVADVIDPYVFMEINDSLSYQEARKLSTQQRARLLAENPVAATNVFYRRVDALFNHFLFGKTRPFQDVEAYLGRVEQQERKSPHLHLLLWLSSKAPTRTGNDLDDGEAIANFIEQFCTAVIPPDQLTPAENLSGPSQKFPVPIVRKPKQPAGLGVKMTGLERHELLSRPCDTAAFNDSMESRRLLGRQILAAQSHICSSYCRPNGEACRFLFPFEPQTRASIVKRWRRPGDLRTVALCPRTHPFLNSTHPMLTAMFKSNTDVTVITGNSIAECAYVCSYAVKADKYSLFNAAALQKLKNLLESAEDNRKLLAAIARGSESVRIIGAQEASDNLLGNPLVFLSAKVLNISTSFLLDTKGALSKDECNEREEERSKNYISRNILGELHPDDLVAIPQTVQHCTAERETKNSPSRRKMDTFIQNYVLRPRCLESLTPSEFFGAYVLCRSTARERLEAEDMLLLEAGANSIASVRNRPITKKIVRLRKKPRGRPQTTHILNVPTRGKAEDDNPSFAAAALVLHTKFRSAEDILKGCTVTDRLKEVLEAPDEYPQVTSYVRRSTEIRRTSYIDDDSKKDPVNGFEETFVETRKGLEDCETLDDWDVDDEEQVVDPLKGLPPMIQNTSKKDPSLVSKNWDGKCLKNPGIKIQSSAFLQYLSDCRAYGVHNANKRFIAHANDEKAISNEKHSQIEAESHVGSDVSSIPRLKENIYKSCRNEEQKNWLRGVFSYLHVYYSCDNPDCSWNLYGLEALKQACRENPIILTNAPGGCGKSWLIRKLKLFISSATQHGAHPLLDVEDEKERCNCENEDLRGCAGRLGRVLVLAPSGVAADNAGGFTFHDALRTYPITGSTTAEDISLKKISQLAKDFSQVVCIIIDEFSMCNLCLLDYLDKLLRILRPSFGHRKFGGIPVIMTGDAFQLPVVRGCGLTSNPSKVPSYLRAMYKHCTETLFFLELNTSVRQEGDSEFSSMLGRIRLAMATNEDANLLNTRFFSDFSVLAQENPAWAYAPILTAKNVTAESLNDAAVARNGEKLGTTHIFSVPVLSRALSPEIRKKRYEQYFRNGIRNKKQQSRMFTRTGFKPYPRLVLYPGIPLMLRTNICPGLGLSNGSVGRLLAVSRREGCEVSLHTPRESLSSVVSRANEGTTRFPAYIPSLLIRIPQGYKGLIGATSSVSNGIENERGGKTVLIEPVTLKGVRGLPVSVAHSFTMHKSQSLTLSRTIIDPRDTFCMGALYVALSRSPSLKKISLISKVSKHQLNKYREQVIDIEKRLDRFKCHAFDMFTFIAAVEKEDQRISTLCHEDILE